MAAVRYKSYTDYGITSEEAKETIEYCRSGEFCQDEVLEKCANSTYPEIAGDLIKSIKSRMSYEKICAKSDIPMLKTDFYGYRRKCIALFVKERKRMETKIWESLTRISLEGLHVPMIVIYDHPDDFPEHVVARVYDMQIPTNAAVLYENLEKAREDVRAAGFMIQIPRDPKDVLSIIEIYMR